MTVIVTSTKTATGTAPIRSVIPLGSREPELALAGWGGTSMPGWLALVLRLCTSLPANMLVTASSPSCTVVATEELDRCLLWWSCGDFSLCGVLEPDFGGRFQTSISMHLQPLLRTYKTRQILENPARASSAGLDIHFDTRLPRLRRDS